MGRRFLLGLLGLTTWLWAAPAQAWGSYTHGLVAERAYWQLAPSHPWLAAQRDAFIWGALAADMDGGAETPFGARAHSAATLAALWREAESGDAGMRAFVLGWALHVESDRLQVGLDPAGFRQALVKAGATDLPDDLEPLVAWALDSALGPAADGTFWQMARAAYVHAGTPAGAPVRRMLKRVLGVDEATYLAWARLQVQMNTGGLDRYLSREADVDGVGAWRSALRKPHVRLALGDLTPWLTKAVNRGIWRVEGLLADPAANDSALQAERKNP